AADLAKDLVADYRDLTKTLKGYIPVAKKCSTEAKTVGDKFKQLIGLGKKHDQLLPVLQALHDKIMAFDEATLKQIARGRRPSGDIQAKHIQIRDSLKDLKGK